MSYGPSFDPYTFLDQWAAVYGREQLGHIAGQDLSLTRHRSPNADKIGAGTTAQSGGRTTVPTVVAPGPLIAPINQPPVTMLNSTGSSAPASQFDHTRYPQTLPGGPVVDDSLPNVDQTFISSPSGAPTLPAPDPGTNHMSIPILFGDPQQVPLPTHSQPPAVLPTDQILADMTALVLSRVPPVRSVIFVMEDRDAYQLSDRFRRLRTPLGVGVELSAGDGFDYMRWDHIPHGNLPYLRTNDGPFHSLWS
ncbi:uncharacterized protein EI90DRAFT_2314294 [Cantharellus anzutake]|uniref:uncharacterized protein n=1 Tax=Cantharellus anzutake TaxID=1750568 RepID=UPI001905BE3B|nr:uncharacterized protein EI90DRAFT_2314294 [Cantharellus anzutake]KAF8339983.1 hypothetical protein EI90DRAFT_2314294 [Cantharellus anzutake]